jgi:hypothetical protein
MPAPTPQRMKAIVMSSLVARGVFVLSALSDIAAIVVGQDQHRLISDIQNVSPAEIAASDDRAAVAVGVQLALFVAAVVAIVVWFRILYGPVYALAGTAMRHTPTWAVWGWLVPFVNLVRPPQMLNDAWRIARRDRPGSPIVGWWWASVLVAGGLYRGAAAAAEDGDTLSAILASIRLDQAADLVSLVGDVLAVVLIGGLTRAVLARFAEVYVRTETSPSS